MKKVPILLTIGGALVTLTATAQLNPPARPLPRHVEGELLVKFAAGPRGAAAKQAQGRMRHEVKRHFDFIGWQQIRLPRGMTVEEGLALYRNLPGVEAVEPNGVMSVIEPVAAADEPQPEGRFSNRPDSAAGKPPLQVTEETAAVVPNDPMFSQQYGLMKIGASNAWAVTTGSTNVIVAVIDSGINYRHEDLAANMWRNPGEIPGNGLDDDGNGFVDDIFGIDTADDAFGKDSDPNDEGTPNASFNDYHGTACAGIIGAVGNNGVGLAGVNWSIRLLALRAGKIDGFFSFGDRVDALNYVVLMKSRGVNIRVVSVSVGGTNFSQALKEAHEAVASHGILQVTAAGNNNSDSDVTPNYPGNYRASNLIVVAASDASDNLPSFSNYGRTNVDLAAPGTGIVMASGPATNAYTTGNGTSFSCPLVAGAAALLFAARPSATAEDVKAALLETVDVLPAFTNKMVSNGRLNLARALGHPESPPVIVEPPQNQIANESSNTTFRVTAYGGRPLFYELRRQSGAVAFSTNGSFTLTNLNEAQTGNYWVVVSNAFGVATSAVVSLTVRTFPRLVGPLTPLQLSAVPGETVTLSVETTGTLPMSYRWRHIPTSGSATVLTNQILNQNRGFLTLTVTTNRAGIYTLILTNAALPASSTQRTNAVLTVLADNDADGLPDAWELAYPNATNAAADTDQDGLTNLQEYRAGTDPQNNQSYLRVGNISLPGSSNAVSVRFIARAQKTYTVETRDAVDVGPWIRVADVIATSNDREVEVIDVEATSRSARYYRLATPRVP